jgi:hypothetical protein
MFACSGKNSHGLNVAIADSKIKVPCEKKNENQIKSYLSPGYFIIDFNRVLGANRAASR